MKILKAIFSDRKFQVCILFVILQQILVGTGTYLMGDLAANVSTKGLSLIKVAMLLTSLVLSGSLFHYLMKYYMVAAQKNVLRKYFESYKNRNFGRTDFWRDVTAKSERHDIMIREGQDSISSSVQFAADTTATSLNILFNTISVILVTNAVMGTSIVCAGILGLVLIHFADKAIGKSASNEMEAQNEVNGFLARSWDNIVLGNRSSFDRWSRKFNELFKSSENASLKNVQVNDAVVAVAGFLTSFIVVITVFYLIYLQKSNTANVVALLVMLPRSMQIVMHIQVIQSYWAHWKYLLQRLSLTEKAIAPAEELSLDQFIDIDKIRISPETTINALIERSAGRFTITGTNGAGKSTLLLKLKRNLKDEGFYIPSHHHLELSKESFAKSSGELAMCALEDATQDQARVILLDEWDANLSKENQEKLNNVINSLSEHKLVIEVRHHIPAV